MASAMNITIVSTEILTQVASYLELEDYKSLRLSCRHVESSLLRTFVWDNFREVQVMRTETSLQTLVALSVSRLARYVERVIVCSELLGTVFSGTERSVRAVDPSRFLAASSHQNALLSTGHDRELRTEAFRNFRLNVVGMRDFGLFSPPPPSLPPSTKGLRMLGKAKLFRQIGADISVVDRLLQRYSNRDEKEHCFRNILYALGRAAARPRRIEVEIGDSRGLPSMALWLPSFMERCVPRVLAELRELHLGVNPGSPTVAESIRCLRQFFLFMPRLQSLHLDMNTFDAQGRCFRSWLGDPTNVSFQGIIQKSLPFAALPELRRIEICGLLLPPASLLDSIREILPTLQGLAFSNICLEDTSRRLIGPSTNVPRPRLWRDFIESLILVDANLKEVRFSKVFQVEGEGIRETAFDIRGSRYIKFASFSYVGPEVRKALEGLVESLSVEGDDDPWAPQLRGRWKLFDPKTEHHNRSLSTPPRGYGDYEDEYDA